jgi:hypothetical protein
MAAEGKTRDGPAHEGTAHSVLEHLKPEEAAVVLDHLLEAHPELAGEADEMARSVLGQQDYEGVAAEVEDEVRALDYDVLNARAGSHEGGYVEPSEAAWEIIEETLDPFLDDLKRHLELGLEAEGLEICQGVVLGCYRLSEREGGDVLGWAPDSPAEAAGNALEIWCRGGNDSEREGGHRKERPPLSADFLSRIPKWIPMVERIGKGKR